MQTNDPFAATMHEWVAVFMRRAMRPFFRCAKEKGLSISQLGALFYIRRRGGSNVSDLGQDLGVTNAAASQMLERMVQQKLILRSEDPLDRRVKQLVLTENGAHAIQDCLVARQSWLDDLSLRLSPGEKEQIVAALTIMIDNLKQLDYPEDEDEPAAQRSLTITEG